MRNATRLGAVCALLAACSSESPDAEPATTVAGALALEVEFVPNLALLRSLEVKLDNRGPTDATITELGFSSPLFESVPTDDLGTVITAGRRRDLPLALGAAVCPGVPGPTVVSVVLDVGDDTWSASAEADADRLEQLNERECGQRAVFERVDIAFAPEHTVVDDVLSARLDVTSRGGAEPVTVTDAGGTLLFSVRPAGPEGARATLAPGADATAVDLTIEVHRCDAHTLSGSTTSYRFPVWLAVGEREPQYVLIEPPADLRAALEALVQACIARTAAG